MQQFWFRRALRMRQWIFPGDSDLQTSADPYWAPERAGDQMW